jgi:hypothetical protein
MHRDLVGGHALSFLYSLPWRLRGANRNRLKLSNEWKGIV